MKKNFVLILLLALAGMATAQNDALNVLFVGNSYTYTNDLPGMVRNMANSTGKNINTTMIAPGGQSFSGHYWMENNGLAYIMQGGWDVIILQEQSSTPAMPDYNMELNCYMYARYLVDTAYDFNPCVEPMFFMTWGYRDGDGFLALDNPAAGTYEGMDSIIAARYMIMKEMCDASVSPVGRVWRYLHDTQPNLALHGSDGSHPSVAGTYAAACSFYTMLFKESPLNITYNSSLPAATAQTIREAAKVIVYDSLSKWQRHAPEADIEATPTAPLQVTFSNLSEIDTDCVWNFGDGNTGTESNPVHTYTRPGTYTVTLKATRHCMTPVAMDTLVLTVDSNSVIQGESKRILFIGNSYTDVNNLPEMIKEAAASAGHGIEYSANLPGGCTFSQHCTNESMRLIQQGSWDVVVLQEQSQLPSFPQEQVEWQVFPYAEQLVEAVYQYNTCAEPMFYMTWGRRDGDRFNADSFPVLGTYEGMDSMLYERYMYMAQTNDASVSPVGRVWRYLRTHHRDIELYDGDGSHPSVAGSYAATCAFYTMLFEDSPLNITYSATLDRDVAETIRNVAKQVVYDSLSYWKRPQPIANFDIVQEGNSIRFNNTSQHATSYWWDFGDGYSTNEPSPLHNYTEEGTYPVSLIATRHCMNDTMIVTVHFPGIIGINQAETMPQISLYPNPASQQAVLHTTMSGTAYLYDMKGRLCRTFQLQEGDNTLSLNNLTPQVYMLRQASTTLKVVIR